MILDLCGYGITDIHKVHDLDGLALYFKVYLTDIEYSDKTDVKRFSSTYKLARFDGMHHLQCHLMVKEKIWLLSRETDGYMQRFIYWWCRMIQKTFKGTERNLAFREYYEKKLGEGKNGQQALICISRRLINIIYGMLKNGIEYRMPEPRNCDEKK